MNPRVSFVVMCYNYGRFLPDCLNSIFGQTWTGEFEVIAVDDCSTDNSVEVIRSFTDPRLRLISHPKNLGQAATINDGLAACRGDFIARIDSDDRYRPDFLATLLPIFDAHPEVGAAYGDAAIIDENGTRCEESCDRVHGGSDYLGNELVALLQENFICAPTLIARREMWLSTDPVPSWLAFNDLYFNIMMARQTEFYYRDCVVADYRVHPANYHVRIVKDKREEPSVFWLLDRVYAESEKWQEVEGEKRRRRHQIYGVQYLTLANKYFGCGLDSDARRCYLAAMRYWPSYAADWGVIRRLFGSIVGRPVYQRAKSMAKSHMNGSWAGR